MPRRPLSRLLLAFAAVVFLTLVVLLWTPLQRLRGTSGLKNSLVRANVAIDENRRVQRPPASLDRMVSDTLDWTFSKAHGYTGRRAADIFHQWYGDLFSEPVQRIEIRNPAGFRGNPGASLVLFPELRRLELTDEGASVTAEEWRRLCASLRRLEKLERLEIGGPHLTDSALAPLAGHPRLSTVFIDANDLSSACSATFASMPSLKTLVIREPQRDVRRALPWSEKDTIAAALHGVDVIFCK